MRKYCYLFLVIAMISCLLASCIEQSADKVLNKMESQIDKLEERAINKKLKSIQDVEKWLEGFSRLSAELKTHRDNMTPEQILRLNQLLTRGSRVTENIYTGGYSRNVVNVLLDEMEALVKEIEDLSKHGIFETVGDAYLKKLENNYKKLISQLNERKDSLTSSQKERLTNILNSLEEY